MGHQGPPKITFEHLGTPLNGKKKTNKKKQIGVKVTIWGPHGTLLVVPGGRRGAARVPGPLMGPQM